MNQVLQVCDYFFPVQQKKKLTKQIVSLKIQVIWDVTLCHWV